MATKLKRLTIDRVDLVDKGANPDAHIVLFKRDVAKNNSSADDSPLDTLTPLLSTFVDKAGRVIAGARLQRLKQAVNALQTIINEAEPEQPAPKTAPMQHDPMTMDKGANMAETIEGVTKRAETAEAQVAVLATQVEVLEKRQAELVAEVDKLQPADPWRGISEDVRKRIEAGEERVAKAEAEVRKRDCIGQVKKYDQLPVNPDDHWSMFDALNGLPDDVQKKVYALLDAHQELARVSPLLKVQGSSGAASGDGSAWDMIQGKAQELVTKGVVKTLAQGIDRVTQDEPDLYVQYEAERRGGV